MSTPFFSLIIPVYNVAPYLDACLQSIKIQQFMDWEAILIDDGSTDESGEICDRYVLDDNRFRVFHKSNEGVSVARNIGIENANGKWIWFIDSDDYIKPNALKCLWDKANTYECDSIFFGIIEEKNGEVRNPDSNRTDIIGMDKNTFLLNIVSYYNPTILFCRKYFVSNQLEFTPELKLAEDLELQYKYLFFAQKPIQIAESLYIYRKREGSAMNSKESHSHNLNCNMKVCMNLLQFIKTNNCPTSQWFTIRIRQLLKSGLQSAEKLPRKELTGIRSQLRHIISEYAHAGYRDIADLTLKIAMTNLHLYFYCLRVFYKIKKIR